MNKWKGTTMGSSLSPVVANIFMEHFETLALNNFHLKPKCWFRFVDDTFVVWPHGQSSLTSFFNHLNSISPHIQFTMEKEKDNSLPFLDVLISCLPNGSLTHQVYRKKRLTPTGTFMRNPITTQPKNMLYLKLLLLEPSVS
jgi:hypothetical protein